MKSANNPERIFTEIKDAIKSEELLYNYVCDNKKESKHEKKMARKYKDPYFNIGLIYCNNCFDGFIIIRLMKKNGSSYSEVEGVRQLIRISKNSVTELLKVL